MQFLASNLVSQDTSQHHVGLGYWTLENFNFAVFVCGLDLRQLCFSFLLI
jgi:hypothetical protein